MFVEMMNGSGGGDLFSLLSAIPSAKITAINGSGSGGAELSVTNGKHYLLVATTTLGSSQSESISITSGATTTWQSDHAKSNPNNNQCGFTRMFLLTATSSTIVVRRSGSGAVPAYILVQLD